MLLSKSDLIKKVEQANTHTLDIMYKTDCIINYRIDEDIYNTVKDKKYLNKINSKKLNKNYHDTSATASSEANSIAAQPICEDVDFSLTCFEHLPSMMQRKKLEMSAETSLTMKELGIFAPAFVSMLTVGLKNEPQSWRYPTLSSYYWRAKGMASRSIACARRALFLAPRRHKDIPLLSLGTILQRSNRSHDAVVVLNAAVDHAPHVAENQIALANGLFLVSEFNRSMECYKAAKALDDSYAEKEKFMRNSMNCFKYIKKNLRKIEKQLVEMRDKVTNYTEGNQNVDKYLEKLLQEQVPIGVRLMEPSFDMYSHHLLNRGQYCSTRMTTDSKEPVLFCDFYSDLQMKLENREWTDTIQKYIDTTTEFVTKHWNFNLGIYKNVNIENYGDDDDDEPSDASGDANAVGTN